MKKTIPITIGILMVLVVVGMVVVSFFTQKFDKDSAEKELVDWKVYRNEEYGFEFMHPKEWEEVGEQYIAFPDRSSGIFINKRNVQEGVTSEISSLRN